MDTPHIYRPKPRRPFESNLAALQTTPQPPSPSRTPSDIFDTPSRTHSVLNLTSSTLGGIYSKSGHDIDTEPPSTPWGTGALSPERKASPVYRRQSFAALPPPKPTTLFSRILRSILLFGIGMLYGLLVRHLHDDRQLAPFQVEGIIKPSHDWRYLIFWGVAGLGLGSLLPWFDKLWEDRLRSPSRGGSASPPEDAIESEDTHGRADWILAVRGVGAFVGIAYAIRKLPWASNMQASLTLALVNPVLWYIIDRSKPGLALSTAVGTTGTALLLALNSEIMPSPAATPLRNTTMTEQVVDSPGSGFEGFSNRGNVEAGIWIASVLFCSCVCFGNIGRRLALNGDGRRFQIKNEQLRRKSMSRVQAARQFQ